jgi:hypothetical protein
MDRTIIQVYNSKIYVAYRLQLDDGLQNLLEYCAEKVNGTTRNTFSEHRNCFSIYARGSMTDASKLYWF